MANVSAKRKIRIVVLMGGPSAEHEVSLKSGAMVLKNLDSRKYVATPIVIGKDGTWPVPPEALKSSYDLAFIAMHGEYGEDGTIQALLESLGMLFTGSDAKASRLGMDKTAAARAFRRVGLKTPPRVDIAKIKTFPVVIKPADRGSSVGVSIVRNAAELPDAILKAHEQSHNVVAEKYIMGREFTCGVLEIKKKPVPLPPTEIILKNTVFFDFKAKYVAGASNEVTPPQNLAAKQLKAIQQAALKAHKAIGARGVTRTDMIMDKSGTLYVLEINTIPGMTETSLVPQEARAYGLSTAKLLDHIVASAL